VKMGSDVGTMFDAALQWRVGTVPQGISADLLATLRGFSREEVDAYALESQLRAVAARSAGKFRRSIVPVLDPNGLTILDHDEYPREDASLETLAALKPAFGILGEKFGLDALVRRAYPHVEHIRHVHTAGNSSGIVDGAAVMLLGSKAKGEALGLKPRARIVSAVSVGSEPLLMLTGPLPATRMALAKAGMSPSDIDLFEVNEAFAAVALTVVQEFDLDPAKVNVNGGAIALGHPLGATGTIILNTALDELEERDLSTALVTLCVGGGMGAATIIERV